MFFLGKITPGQHGHQGARLEQRAARPAGWCGCWCCRSASAGVPVCNHTSTQISGLPGRTCSRSPWLMLALQTGDQWSGAEYSKGMERLSLPGPRTWGLGQAEAPKPLRRWCRPHSISAPSSNAAHVGQLPARGCGARSRQCWAGRQARRVAWHQLLLSKQAVLLRIFPLSALIAVLGV